MIEKLDALATLQAAGTMVRAATLLRITQSAVSKRVAALENEVGQKLVERHGRRVRLTREGERLLEDARPLLTALREVLHAHSARQRDVLRVAATDSLLASWLPLTLRTGLDRLPSLTVELHAHRGVALLARLKAGDYTLGFCPAVRGDKELVVRELAREPMVIVPRRFEPLAREAVVPVWAIEKQSLTWEAIARRIPRLPQMVGFAITIESRLESFTALVQVARAGFANVLVPLGVAREFGVPSEHLVRLGDLTRPIAAVGRRSAFQLPSVQKLLGELAPLWPS